MYYKQSLIHLYKSGCVIRFVFEYPATRYFQSDGISSRFSIHNGTSFLGFIIRRFNSCSQPIKPYSIFTALSIARNWGIYRYRCSVNCKTCFRFFATCKKNNNRQYKK